MAFFISIFRFQKIDIFKKETCQTFRLPPDRFGWAFLVPRWGAAVTCSEKMACNEIWWIMIGNRIIFSDRDLVCFERWTPRDEL